MKVGESRYEIKLVAERSDLARILMWLRLHPEAFSVSYPERRVNNIYFDTPDLANVAANLAGISERRKIRLRWYGETSEIAKGTWELKCRQAGMGWKISQAVDGTIPLKTTTWKKIFDILSDNASDTIAAHLRTMSVPTLVNYYERLYYVSWDGALRATVDHNQVYFGQTLSARPNLTRPSPVRDHIVLELKALPEEYDRIVNAIQHFPMRIARNSKYMNGMMGSTL